MHDGQSLSYKLITFFTLFIIDRVKIRSMRCPNAFNKKVFNPTYLSFLYYYDRHAHLKLFFSLDLIKLRYFSIFNTTLLGAINKGLKDKIF